MGFELPDGRAAAKVIKELAYATMSSWSEDVTVRLRRHPTLISISFRAQNGDDVAKFTLAQQANCNGSLASIDTHVYEAYRGRGIAQELQILKECIAKEFGYSSLVATVNLSNEAEVHILEKTGWTKGWEFTNTRYNISNKVAYYFKEIR